MLHHYFPDNFVYAIRNRNKVNAGGLVAYINSGLVIFGNAGAVAENLLAQYIYHTYADVLTSFKTIIDVYKTGGRVREYVQVFLKRSFFGGSANGGYVYMRRFS